MFLGSVLYEFLLSVAENVWSLDFHEQVLHSWDFLSGLKKEEFLFSEYLFSCW